MKKSDLIELIENWDAFTQENESPTLSSFANWLLQKKEGTPNITELGRTIGYNLFRIERYEKIRIKTIFKDLPLIGYDDFILLNTVYHNPDIPKKSLYDIQIYEMNSGTQIINRLKREGLMVDSQSEEDKRVFLLRITEEGKRIRDIAFERLGKEVDRKYSIFGQEELEQFLSYIKTLEGHLASLRLKGTDFNTDE